MNADWLPVAAAGAALGGIALDRLIHPARKVQRRWEEFLDDWNGKPERKTADGAVTLDERQPGVVEQIHNMRVTQQADSQRLAKVEQQLNGGGLGSQMNALGAQVAQMDARHEEHLDCADAAKAEILGEVAAVKEQVGETQRFVYQRLPELEERVDRIDNTMTGRLFVVEDAERTHRAMLHEVGFDVDLPDPDGVA